MRIATSIMVAIALLLPTLVLAVPGARKAQTQKEINTPAPQVASSAVRRLFEDFGLFGTWAVDCKQPASPDNPHVRIASVESELVQEDHDLGPDFTINHYSVLSAERLSPTNLSAVMIFQPGTDDEEKQKLIFLVRNNTRRTLFNQPDAGPVRVKEGIALARGTKTPLLTKCE
jgi:hypothetical protein